MNTQPFGDGSCPECRVNGQSVPATVFFTTQREPQYLGLSMQACNAHFRGWESTGNVLASSVYRVKA